MPVDNPAAIAVMRQTMVVRIATLSRSGRPSVTPIYFVCASGHIWIGTVDWTLAVRDVKADPRVSLLFAPEQQQPNKQRILRVSGSAIVHSDPKVQRVYNLRAAFKYFLTPAGLWHRLTHLGMQKYVRQYHIQNAEKGSPCVIAITPEQAEFLDGD